MTRWFEVNCVTVLYDAVLTLRHRPNLLVASLEEVLVDLNKSHPRSYIMQLLHSHFGLNYIYIQ
jgi:hypothetical protein